MEMFKGEQEEPRREETSKKVNSTTADSRMLVVGTGENIPPCPFQTEASNSDELMTVVVDHAKSTNSAGLSSSQYYSEEDASLKSKNGYCLGGIGEIIICCCILACLSAVSEPPRRN
jgi:predicted small metal-binding protein